MYRSEFLPQNEWDRSMDKENFINFDLEASPKSNSIFTAFVEKIYDDYNCKVLIVPKTKAKIKTARSNIMKCLRSLVWQLYRAQAFNLDWYLAISMSSNTYYLKNPQNPYQISRKILDIIRHLVESKHLSLDIGFLDHNTKKSRLSRIRPTIDFMNRLHGLPRNLKSDLRLPVSVLVRNRGSKKNLETDNTIIDEDYLNANDVITRYNEFISKKHIHFSSDSPEDHIWTDKNNRDHKVDLDKKFLHAVIHRDLDGSLSYFRMHGAFWQSLPSVYRWDIQIDREKTICLDYSAQIINIVGSISDTQIPKDAYNIDLGYPSIPSDLSRIIVKYAVMIFTNSDSKRKAYNGLRNNIRSELKGKKFPEKLNNKFFDHIYACIINKYPFFEQYMFHSGGSLVFKNDAKIARMIMTIFLDHDKAILPIHDGFIVAEGDCDFLHKAMEDVWLERFGTTIEIKKE
jgi:hypothetical protein